MQTPPEVEVEPASEVFFLKFSLNDEEQPSTGMKIDDCEEKK